MSQQSYGETRKPRTDDRPLWDIVFGVYGYPALLLAHKLKLFVRHEVALLEWWNFHPG